MTFDNHFDLFGLKPSFDVEKKKLHDVYLDLQKKFHPDNFANNTEQEKLLSSQVASNINQAYQTLKSDILRAEYLIKLKNPNFKDDNSIKDIEFLEVQMELREKLVEIDSQNDKKLFINNIENSINNLKQQFDDKYPKQITNAENILQKLKFFDKLKKQAQEIIF